MSRPELLKRPFAGRSCVWALVSSLAALVVSACGGGSNTPVRAMDVSPLPDDAIGDVAPTPDAQNDGSGASPGVGSDTDASTAGDSDSGPVACQTVRVATFNASLFRDAQGQLLQDLQQGDVQAQAVAQIIRSVRPDILLLNEFDEDLSGETLRIFQENYLQNVALAPTAPITFSHAWIAPSNTGVSAGVDLSGDDQVAAAPGTPNWAADSFGYGTFPGQYSFAVLSNFTINANEIRTFQTFLWKDFEGAILPDNAATEAPGDYYSAAALEVFRLSSKTHADIPIQVGEQTLHFLVSHPTPPAFDGPEDRNGRRNHDEVVFWARYIDGAAWVYDDAGSTGGLESGSSFIIAGDLNSDPLDPAENLHPVAELLGHSRVNATLVPASEGARLAALAQGGVNAQHRGDPAFDTADFADNSVGNLRIDYVLPSNDLTVVGAGVFWPTAGQPGFEWVGDFPFASSDHRAVWIDLLVPGSLENCPSDTSQEP